MSRGDIRHRDLLAPSEHEPELEGDALQLAPGKVTLADAAALGGRMAVSPGKVSRTSMMAVQRRAVQRVPGEDGDEGGDHFVPVSRETLAQIDELLGNIGASREEVPSHEVIASSTPAENAAAEMTMNAEAAWSRRQLEFGPAVREDAAREEPAQPGAPHATQSPAAPEEQRAEMTPRWGLSIMIGNYNHWHDLSQVRRWLRRGSGFRNAFAAGMDNVVHQRDRTGQQMYDDIFGTIWDLSMQVQEGHVAHLTVYITGHGGAEGVFGIDERDGPSLRPETLTALGRMASEHNVHVTFILDSCNIGLMVSHAQVNMVGDLNEDIDDNRTDSAELRQRLATAGEIARPGFGMSAALLGLYSRRPLRTTQARADGAQLYQNYQTALAALEAYVAEDHPGAPDLSRIQSRIGRARSTFDRIADQVNFRNMQALRTASAPLIDAINDAINANLVSVREQLGRDASPHAGRALGNPQQGAGRALGNPSQGAGRALGDPVQRARKQGEHPDDVAAAESGVSGAGGQMPFSNQLQRAFGHHDIGSMRAHTGAKASEAATTLGARAYATGSDVAFDGEPDLHTAAHEAAHVVQQRGGVQLAGGFGSEGDRYERHADQVADAVVGGKSAEGLLDEMAPAAGADMGGSAQTAVQRHPGDDDDDDDGGGLADPDRDALISSYPDRDSLPDSTIVYRFARSSDGAMDGSGRTWWDTEPNTNHGGPRGNRHLLQTTIGELRASGQVRGDPEESETSLIVFHDDTAGTVPGTEVESGVVGFSSSGSPIYRVGHPNYHQPAGRWVDNAGTQHFGDEEPDGPPFERWQGGTQATAPLNAHADNADLASDGATAPAAPAAPAAPPNPRRPTEVAGARPAGAIAPPTNYDPRERNREPDDDAEPEGGGGSGGGGPSPRPPRRPTRVAGSSEPAEITAPSDYGVLMVGDDPPGTDPERTSRRASALRRDLEIRQRHAPNRDARQAAERGLASLDRAGDEPSERQLQHVANQAGTDLDEAERHGETATAERAPDGPTGSLGTDSATLSSNGVSGNARVDPRTGGVRAGVTVPTAGGTRTRLRGSASNTADGGSNQGGDAQVTVPTGTGRSVSVQGGVNEERGPDGELRGRDRTAGASFDGGSFGLGVTVGSGWRCYASRVHQDASNAQHFTVPWRLQITTQFAAELEVRIGGGFSVGEELERSGVHVVDASGSSSEAIETGRSQAEEWRRSFHQMNRERVDSLFADDPTSGGHANHDIEYWRDAPVGTSERVRSQSTLGASITVPLGQYLEVGGGYEHQGSESSEIAKNGAETVRVTQIVGSRAGADGTVGAMGTSMTMGERDIRISRVVVEANLTTAAGQITQFLSTGRTLRPGQSGVQLIEILPTTGTAESTGIHFLGLGGTTEGQVTRTRGVRRNPETGELEEVDQFEGQHNEQQSGLAGMRQQSNTTVTAPNGADDDYVITQTIQGNREQAVRNELAETTGNSRRDVSDHNVVNGTWNVSERFTQGQIATFCARFMQRHREIDRARGRDPDERVSFFGIELEPSGAYDSLYRRLSAINASPSGEEEEAQARAQRGEAISEFIQATGQEGVRLIRASAGGGQQVITRTTADGEADTNFMSIEERQRLDGAIERWNGQIEALGQRGGPLNRDADNEDAEAIDSTGDVDVLRTQITNELTQMRARREAMMNEHNYRSLPLPERQDIDRDYERYVGQLEGLLTRLQDGRDSAVAASYGEETQAEQHEMEATRLRATQTRQEVQALREHTLLYRRRFGQIDSETWEYRLGASDNRRSNRMFRTAETARTQAEEFMTIGANRTNEVEGPEWGATTTSAYRMADQQYQRAVEEFEAARTVLTRLNRIYAAALRNPDQTAPDTEGAADSSGADSSDTTDSDSETATSADEERAERRRRRRRQRRERERAAASRGPAAERTEGDEADAEDTTAETTYSFSIPREALGRRIHVGANGHLGIIDFSPISLSEGLVVRPATPPLVERFSHAAADAAAGGRELYAIRMIVLHAANRRFTHIETFATGRDGRTVRFHVENAEGATFACSAVTSRPSLAVE